MVRNWHKKAIDRVVEIVLNYYNNKRTDLSYDASQSEFLDAFETLHGKQYPKFKA